MNKYILLLCSALLFSCSKDKESDYTMNLSETGAVIAVVRDQIMTCKGQAMMGNKERAKDCYFNEYLPLAADGSRYKIAVKEFFARAEADKSRQKDPQYLNILRDINMVTDASNYLLEYLK